MPSVDLTPPAGAREEAQRGLDWRREHGRGGTEVGIARARDIANGRSLSEETIARMVSYFARHEVDKQGQGWNQGEPGYPSNGRIAWALWGGDAGRAWAESVSAQLERETMGAPGYSGGGLHSPGALEKPTVIKSMARLFSVPAFRFAAPSPTDALGKWSRFATFGTKSQDGEEIQFTETTLGQMVDNWIDRGDKLAICQDHLSAYVATTGRPAPALGFFTALALVSGGRVTKFASTVEGIEAPSGVPDGLYGYLGELTPLGLDVREGLANFAMLSPMFETNGEDEQGKPIGFTLFDVAATNTPFQAGTAIQFHRVGAAAREGAKTMDKEPKQDEPKALTYAECAEKLAKKFGWDSAEDMMAKMGDLIIKHEDDDDEEKGEEEADKEEAEAMRKLAEEVGVDDGPKKMSRALVAFRAKFAPQSEIAALKGEVATLSRKLADREAAEADAALSAFVDAAIAEGRWDRTKREALKTFARADRKAAESSLLPQGTYTLLGKMAPSSQSEGSRIRAGVATEPQDGRMVMGRRLSDEAKKYAREHGVPLERALLEVARRDQSLADDYVGAR